MLKNRYAFLIIAMASATWTSMTFAAPPATSTPPARAHAPERPEEPAATPGSAELDAQIAHLRAIRERLSRETSPKQRRMLLAERVQVMQQAMATMHAQGDMPRGCGGASGHVALMQEMMYAVADESSSSGLVAR